MISITQKQLPGKNCSRIKGNVIKHCDVQRRIMARDVKQHLSMFRPPSGCKARFEVAFDSKVNLKVTTKPHDKYPSNISCKWSLKQYDERTL